MKLRLVFIVLIVVAAESTFAVEKFYTVNSILGVSMRENASVCKDENGFIWTSSKTGVMRISGNDYSIYQMPFEAKDILTIKLAYRDKILLAYCNNGQIFRYNAIFDRFELVINLEKEINANHRLSIRTAMIDANGNFWILSNMGFYRFTDGKLDFFNDPDSEIMRVALFDASHIVYMNADKIKLLDINTLQHNTLYEHKEPFAYIASCLLYDKDLQRLWIGTNSKGLLYYDLTSNKMFPIDARNCPKQYIMDIEPSLDGNLLIGIDGQGIWKLDKYGARTLSVHKENPDDAYSLSGNGVYDIFCDRETGKTWVCTYSGGLSYFENTKPLVTQIRHEANNSNSLVNNNINQIIEDSYGKLWFATDNGVSYFDLNSGQWTNLLHSTQEPTTFMSLCEDSEKRIWTGTYSSGVYVIDEKSGKIIAHYSRDAGNSVFNCNFVYDIILDKQNTLWLGGIYEGLYSYIPYTKTFNRYPVVPFYTIYDLSDTLLLACCPFGLYLLDKITQERELLTSGLNVQDVIVLNGYAWLCTQGNGLVQFDIKNRKIEAEYTTENGLPSDYLSSIAKDDDFLWIGSESGLCRFNTTDKTVTFFSSLFPKVSFNRNAHCTLRDGRIIWGTSGGAIVFKPALLQQSQMMGGKIYLQDIVVSGRSIRENEKFNLKTPVDSLKNITLPYNQNNLTVHVVPLGENTDSRISWAMRGLDNSENHPSAIRNIAYSNLQPGKYTLHIKLLDNSLTHIIATRQLQIIVTPPFWETWWFFLICAVFISSVVFSSLRFYIYRLKQQYTEDKVRFFTNMAHEIRTAITLIKAPIDELNKKKFPKEDSYFLNLAAEQARRLSSTVTHLLDFQKSDAGKGQVSLTMVDIPQLIRNRLMMFESCAKSRNIHLAYSSNQTEYSSAIDESKIEQVVDNLISNAIKYSYENSSVHIRFGGYEKKWILEVRDTGIGIGKNGLQKLFSEFYRCENAINSNITGSGIGLLLAKNYINLHRGKISCTSKENFGSTFTVSIPYKKVAELKPIQSVQPVVLTETENDEETASKKQMRLLVVEDNPDLLNFMKCSLNKEYEVFEARNGADAWKAVCKLMPDIVVSDVMMPEMDGFELCRLIKSTFETSHIPVVLLTSLAEKENQLKGFGLGADNYLTKPFDIELVRERIASIVKNRRAIREKAFKLIGGADDEKLFVNELNDTFVKKAVETVQKNIANTEFGKDSFAAAMNVSSPLLYKKLKSLTNMSPIDFIRSIRLNHAMELLITKQFTVTEVCYQCGFSDLTYFGKSFKKYFGKKPSDL